MYSDLINNLSYLISFDFAGPYDLLLKYTDMLTPMFLSVLGVRVGVACFKYLIK